ncbi:Peptidyl-prolyl cis-trans isomerase [Candidatus Terasakiella magnetica]|uniref:Peptidyl-prolyl cis-trans isomerase n=1 Tax=Candidatus Terasakiella magnetica TaxID=1867952 RepID=A0A1C3RIB7_9PROT|nr:FKBP-type peptidyl-prolyl cis-trans isomerase [Candidatus Terasakiella magnetica]SCA57016.1 Peptidyl-prolyl cis-trans isomerase [Candidatus Terasakiella magnetica]
MMRPVFKLLSLALVMSVLSSVGHSAELKVTDVIKGKGALAEKEKQVRVHYTGWLMNGNKFDSSKDRDRPFSFTLGARQVIPGWDQGVQGMRVGGLRELIIPPEMAYGPRGAGGVIQPNATLKFEVELLEVMEPPFKNINNEEVKALLKEGVKIVDVRTPAEWKKTGVIQGSLLLPFRMANGQINPKFPEDMARIADKKERVMLICRTGNRTRMASELLAMRFGFENVYNVRNGITYWLREKNQTVAPQMDMLKSTCSLC